MGCKFTYNVCVQMEHSAWLEDSCRVCGGRLGRFKVSYNCHSKQNKSKLQAIGISVEQDKKTVHPSRFCHSCYNICTRTIKATESGKNYNPILTKFEWTQHTATECIVCTRFSVEKRGRKPKNPRWVDHQTSC